jgi:hypothetical protein
MKLIIVNPNYSLPFIKNCECEQEGIDGKIKIILIKYGINVRAECSWLRIELLLIPSDFIKC